MKRTLVLVSLLAAAYVAGAAFPGVMVAQQPAAPAAQGGAPQAPSSFYPSSGRGRGNAPDGRTTEDARAASNMFLLRGLPEGRAQLGKARLFTREEQNAARSHLEWAPQYRLTATTRPATQSGQVPTQGEMHTDNTQIYLVTGGSGTVIVEGKVDPANEYLVAPGEHRGGPIVGGRPIRVKVGDLLSIPPYTWHIGYGDPGVPLQYVIIHINTRQTIP